MNSQILAADGGVFLADRMAGWNDLSSSAPSQIEVVGGKTTLVVVDMQQIYLSSFTSSTAPLVEAVIRQIRLAMKMGWSIVLLEFKPWRNGETISPIMDVLNSEGPVESGGKYPLFVRCSKQTPSGARELLKACYENGFGMELFRITGVYLDACVLETVEALVRREPRSLVRFIEEACSTDIDPAGAWATVHRYLDANLRVAVSSESTDA